MLLQPIPLFLIWLQPLPLSHMLLQPHPLLLSLIATLHFIPYAAIISEEEVLAT